MEAAELVELEEKLAAAEGRPLEVLRQEREGPGSLVTPGPRSPASNSSPFTGSWPTTLWGRGG